MKQFDMLIRPSSSFKQPTINPLRTFRLAAILLLMMSGSVAWGQAVIMNGDYYLTHNEAGTTVNATATTTFNPATCLWAYARRDYIRTANSRGTVINNNNNNYLQNSTTVSLGNDEDQSEPEEAMDGELKITSKHARIIVKSGLSKETTVHIVNAGGAVISVYTIQPGEVVDTRVAAGVYLVNQTKIVVK